MIKLEVSWKDARNFCRSMHDEFGCKQTERYINEAKEDIGFVFDGKIQYTATFDNIQKKAWIGILP